MRSPSSALLEWWLAMQRAKLVQSFGFFYGIAFREDKPAQEKADHEAGLDRIYITEERRGVAPRICPAHGGPARWIQAQPWIVPADDPGLHLVRGFLMWRPPPWARSPQPRAGPDPGAAELEAEMIAVHGADDVAYEAALSASYYDVF